jgi:hypothetical protein
MLQFAQKRDLPSCNRPVVYFRQETGYNGYRGAFVFLPGFLLEAQHNSAQATSTFPLTAVDNVDLLPGMK